MNLGIDFTFSPSGLLNSQHLGYFLFLSFVEANDETEAKKYHLLTCKHHLILEELEILVVILNGCIIVNEIFCHDSFFSVNQFCILVGISLMETLSLIL